MGDLLKLQEQAAKSSAINESTGPHSGLTDEQVMQLADRLVDECGDACKSPVALKALLLECINRAITWHSTIGHDLAKESSDDEGAMTAMCWLRDAGKFQAALGIILSIGCGPHDWTMNNN